MDDFGGTNGVFGDIPNVISRIESAMSDPSATTLAGTGISMEGIDQNPSYYEAVLQGLWVDVGGDADLDSLGNTRVDGVAPQNSSTPTQYSNAPTQNSSAPTQNSSTPTQYSNATAAAETFLVDFGVRRCGKRLPAVEEAWKILARTTFRSGGGVGLGHAYCTNINPKGLKLCSLTSGCGFWRGGYNTATDVAAYTDDLMEAWVLLTNSAEECGTNAARFDVADIGREWLQSVRCVDAYRNLTVAWNSKTSGRCTHPFPKEPAQRILVDPSCR
jgi:hypothetical protein